MYHELSGEFSLPFLFLSFLRDSARLDCADISEEPYLRHVSEPGNKAVVFLICPLNWLPEIFVILMLSCITDGVLFLVVLLISLASHFALFFRVASSMHKSQH